LLFNKKHQYLRDKLEVNIIPKANTMKLKLISLLTALFIIPSLANAEFVIVNGNSWDKEITGQIRDDNDILSEVDLKNDLLLTDSKESFFVAYIEHPIPVLPNIRIGSTSLNFEGSGTVTKSFTYNNVTYNGSVNIATKLNLDHTEIAFYWNVLDNVVGLDLGLNVKSFDGVIKLTSSAGNVNEVFDETVPMLYGGLQIELGAGFQLAGDISYISFDGSSFTDSLIRLRYTSDYLIGAEIGYRSFVIDYEDTSANEFVKIDVSGPYAGLHLAF